jgi:CRP-like cAMP-binding protein
VIRKLSSHSALGDGASEGLPAFLGRARKYPRGYMIHQPGEPAGAISILQQGAACRMTLLPNGARQINGLLLPGDAEDIATSLLARRTSSVQALTDCAMWIIPRSRLALLSQANPRLGEALQREAAISADVGREWCVNLGRRTAQQRIAHLLCELSARMDAVGIGEEGTYPFMLSQRDIADVGGLTSVHVNRVLKQLKRLGLINLRGKSLTILDRAALARIAIFDPSFLHLRPN